MYTSRWPLSVGGQHTSWRSHEILQKEPELTQVQLGRLPSLRTLPEPLHPARWVTDGFQAVGSEELGTWGSQPLTTKYDCSLPLTWAQPSPEPPGQASPSWGQMCPT